MSRPPSPCVWVRDTKEAAAAKPTTRKTISEMVVRRRRVDRASCSSVARGAEAWNAPLRWRWAENIEEENTRQKHLTTLSKGVKSIPGLQRGGVLDRPASKRLPNKHAKRVARGAGGLVLVAQGRNAVAA